MAFFLNCQMWPNEMPFIMETKVNGNAIGNIVLSFILMINKNMANFKTFVVRPEMIMGNGDGDLIVCVRGRDILKMFS